jgi:hypothetical protein
MHKNADILAGYSQIQTSFLFAAIFKLMYNYNNNRRASHIILGLGLEFYQILFIQNVLSDFNFRFA